MSHYDTLGVGRTATASEVRAAYLKAARLAHPDVAGEAGAESMRKLNAAFAILGSVDARATYDKELARHDVRATRAAQTQARPSAPGGSQPSGRAGRTGSGERVKPQHDPFVVHQAFRADEGTDDWRYEPDEGDPATAPGRALQMLPPALLILGIVIGALGIIIGSQFVAVGMVISLLGVVSFLFVPLVTMSRAVSAEKRR